MNKFNFYACFEDIRPWANRYRIYHMSYGTRDGKSGLFREWGNLGHERKSIFLPGLTEEEALEVALPFAVARSRNGYTLTACRCSHGSFDGYVALRRKINDLSRDNVS